MQVPLLLMGRSNAGNKLETDKDTYPTLSTRKSGEVDVEGELLDGKRGHHTLLAGSVTYLWAIQPECL